ncbi:uncharacterized protein PHALS_05675 [Plasmopara halstedii]|uniref:Uncharacterized protein n=1 Tax=Plasmopara halstedii TaxID=4781 RepID=A0A0P1B0M0_PLAHL|nr:uncharacterized protein PHALS_05675 [Plasmopara halstedii]CEG48205.1 hypothetical protein PHALS_05675 [Plasmopara halstedii]|eukprot:XP_024584574.1 hypothetical protein PHALS_05675 [Plasmopara halstedii]
MEPMDSNVLMKKLGITIKMAKLDKQKGVSLAAKRRKTLNWPLTQQDEDEVTVSQARTLLQPKVGIKRESVHAQVHSMTD